MDSKASAVIYSHNCSMIQGRTKHFLYLALVYHNTQFVAVTMIYILRILYMNY